MDSKIFEVDGTKLRVSVLETTAPSIPLNRKADLMTAMPSVAADDGAAEVLFVRGRHPERRGNFADPERCREKHRRKLIRCYGGGRYGGFARCDEPQKADRAEPEGINMGPSEF